MVTSTSPTQYLARPLQRRNERRTAHLQCREPELRAPSTCAACWSDPPTSRAVCTCTCTCTCTFTPKGTPKCFSNTAGLKVHAPRAAPARRHCAIIVSDFYLIFLIRYSISLRNVPGVNHAFPRFSAEPWPRPPPWRVTVVTTAPHTPTATTHHTPHTIPPTPIPHATPTRSAPTFQN